jgi:hypothetical protein
MAKEYVNRKWAELMAIRSEMESGEEVKLEAGRVEFQEVVWLWEAYRAHHNLQYDEK